MRQDQGFPQSFDKIPHVSDAELHSALITTVNYAMSHELPREELVDLIEMLTKTPSREEREKGR
jgi:hypothetical protein